MTSRHPRLQIGEQSVHHGRSQLSRGRLDRQLKDRTERGFVFVRSDGTERSLTFADLKVEAEKRAAQMYARGLKKGDRLAIAVPDPDEFVLSFLGAVMGGIVPVPISPQLSLNFGNGNGWSYLSVGIGRSLWSITPDGAQSRPIDEEPIRTINYGGGARWFIKPHLAFSLDGAMRSAAADSSVRTSTTGRFGSVS